MFAARNEGRCVLRDGCREAASKPTAVRHDPDRPEGVRPTHSSVATPFRSYLRAKDENALPVVDPIKFVPSDRIDPLFTTFII